MKVFFGARRGRTVGGLSQHFRFDTFAVFQSDLILESRRDKDVACCVPDGVRTEIGLAARKTLDGTMFLAPLIKFFDGQSVRVCDHAIPFADRDNLAAVFLRQKLRGVVADIAESLK